VQNYEIFVERAHDLTKSNKKKEISVIHVIMVASKCADSFYEKNHSLILIFRFLLLFLQNDNLKIEYAQNTVIHNGKGYMEFSVLEHRLL
jgi:hypothetical protein